MRFRDLAPGPAPQLPLEAYVRRRARLAKALGPGHAVVVATHTTKQFSHDVDYLFRPHSDFWYLTGFNEPGAVLVLEAGSGASPRTTLFLRDRKPEAEIWTGRRLGVARAPAALGVDRAYPIEDLATRLPAVLKGARHVHAIAAHDPAVERRVQRVAGRGRFVRPRADARPGGPAKAAAGAAPAGPEHAVEALHALRSVKEPAELAMLRKACALGVEAQLAAAARLRPGAMEYQTEADLLHHYRRAGSTGPGYPAICGCGPNAAVLHYITNLQAVRRDRLMLVDAGCEWGYYTSDITRTWPVGGRFNPLQARLYDLVLDAHQAALRKVRPGNRFRDPHDAAVKVLAEGLVELGYLKGDAATAIRDTTYRSFFMHGTSHFLGLDVHDAGATREADGSSRILRPGMVLTVEPGLYFNPDYAKCPPGTKGIGIRIEDDVVVTETGHRNLTRSLPVERADVEACVPRSRTRA